MLDNVGKSVFKHIKNVIFKRVKKKLHINQQSLTPVIFWSGKEGNEKYNNFNKPF